MFWGYQMPSAPQKLLMCFWILTGGGTAACRDHSEAIKIKHCAEGEQCHEPHAGTAKHWGFGESTVGEDLPHQQPGILFTGCCSNQRDCHSLPRAFCLFTQLRASTENKLPTAEQVAKTLSQGRVLGRIVT